MLSGRFYTVRGYTIRGALALSFILSFVLCNQALAQHLVVGVWGTERALLELDLSRNPTWEVRWNHSVAGFTVRDVYRYEDGEMLLSATHAPDFAAGLGHIPGRGRLESDGAGGYWIRGIDEAVPGDRYLLRVGAPRVDHRVVHAGVTYSLSAQAAGERVVVAVEAP